MDLVTEILREKGMTPSDLEKMLKIIQADPRAIDALNSKYDLLVEKDEKEALNDSEKWEAAQKKRLEKLKKECSYSAKSDAAQFLSDVDRDIKRAKQNPYSRVDIGEATIQSLHPNESTTVAQLEANFRVLSAIVNATSNRYIDAIE